MRRLLNWIKTNKLTAFLGLLVLYFVFKNFFGLSLRQAKPSLSRESLYGGIANAPMGVEAPGALRAPSFGLPPVYQEAPPSDTAERLVVRETNLSLLVEDVRKTSDEILSFVETQGGYMVSTTLTQPEEAPYASIVVRVPSLTLNESLEYFRSRAIKVSSEYVSGRDVTDEYEDIETRLETLERNKARFEEIMERAVEIDEILRVQREIFNLQNQIDSLKGRQQLLEQTAKLSRVTIHLSTDEIALPYTPSETFRPAVIFKLAWRSLVKNLRKIAEAFIWIMVYALIWVPVLGSVLFIKRWRAKRTTREPHQ